MHLLAFILMFIISSIAAALKGDYSGTAFIGRILIAIGIFFFFGCILTGFSAEGSGTIFIVATAMTIFGGFLAAQE